MQSIEFIIFEEAASQEWVYVYLHGAGEFGRNIDSLYRYRDFPLLLKNRELIPAHPFIVFHALNGDNWEVESIKIHLNLVSERFPMAKIHLIGFSRGGLGVYEYISRYSSASKATVINSRIYERLNTSTPVEVLHAVHDQRSKIEDVRRFVMHQSAIGRNIILQEFEGDHFSVAEIALSGFVIKEKQ